MRAKANDKASDTLQEVLQRLRHGNPLQLALDTETSGLDWRRNHIVGYVVTFSDDPRDSYYVPFRHEGTANVGGQPGPDTPHGWKGKLSPGEAELIAELDRSELMIVGHHLAFDLKFLSCVGYTMQPRFEDTIINEPLIDELIGRYSLDSCAHRHKVQAKKSQLIYDHIHNKFPEVPADKKSMGHFWRLSGDDPIANEYAAGDGTTTWQLRDAQMKVIKKTDVYMGQEVPSMELVHDIESRLIPILARMTIKGIKIDEARLEELLEHIGGTERNGSGQIDRLLNEFPPDFNTKSPKDVRAWMEKHGNTDWPLTMPSKMFPNGQPSFKEEWLKKSPAGQKVVKIRKLTTLRDSFLVPARDTHIFKGRIHTEFHQLREDDFGTVTGRLSSSSPNMQAIPKHDPENSKLIRSMFIPDKGMTWGSTDYSQMEPRLLAYYSRCKVLMEGYKANPPVDAHTAASIAMNDNWHNLDKLGQKVYRDAYGKRINQTLITGGGANVLVEKYGMDPRDVRTKMSDYFRAMPEIKVFQKSASARFRNRGYMLSLLDRRMRLDDVRYDYRALNRLLQTGNAEALKLKMVEIGEFLNKADPKHETIDLLLNCHDSVDYQYTVDGESHYHTCIKMMEDFSSDKAVIKLDVPIVVDHGEGRNWSIATWGDK